MIHQPKAAGPALWITAALVMNSTIETKIATMSKVLRTLRQHPPRHALGEQFPGPLRPRRRHACPFKRPESTLRRAVTYVNDGVLLSAAFQPCEFRARLVTRRA